jgi:hypothetical protein
VSAPDGTDGGTGLDVSPGIPERRPLSERRRHRHAASGGEEELPPPTSRREMRARGISLTTEVPVIRVPPDWQEKLAAAHAAERASAERVAAQRAVAAGAASRAATAASTAPSAVRASATQAPVPSRRALRERLREAEPAAARTGAGTQPTIRPPSTAKAVRTVEDTGAISAIQPVVTSPEAEAAAAPPAVRGGQVAAPEWGTSPSAWESAVSMPAIVVDLDLVRAATGSLEAAADAGSVEEPESAPEAAPAAPPVEAAAPPAQAVPAAATGAAGAGEAASSSARWPYTGWVRVVILVLSGVALGMLIYLIWTAALGSGFAAGAEPSVVRAASSSPAVLQTDPSAA